MKTSYIIFWIIPLFITTQVFSQNNYDRWYFGYGAGIDFSSGYAELRNDMPNNGFNAWETCAVQSEFDTGELSFYTDGQNVFNRNHEIMPNGGNLLGHPSASQGVIIIPRPNAANQFFLITTDYRFDGDGLNYSVVDMTLNGGMGDVTEEKNIQLRPVISEGITATKHGNGQDYWLIAHDWGNNDIFCYQVTENGIAPTPTISSVGSIRNSGMSYANYTKVSPNGKMIITTGYKQKIIDLFLFDNNTGILSDWIPLPSNDWVWGCTFSPDNSKVYILTSNLSPNKVLQYDVSTYVNESVINSEVIISENSTSNIGAAQIAPDGKIYISHEEGSYLSIIHCPNESGLSCGFEEKGFFLEDRNSRWSIPNLIDDQFNGETFQLLAEDLSYSDTCFGEPTQFNIKSNASDYFWDFGDSKSGEENTAFSRNPSHIFSEPDAYIVKLILFDKCVSDTLEFNVTIDPPPKISEAIIEPTTCTGNNGSLILFGEGGYGNLSFSIDNIFFQTHGVFEGLEARIYSTIVKDEKGCTSQSPFEVKNGPSPTLEAEILQNSPISQFQANQGVVFLAKAQNVDDIWWDFGNGIIKEGDSINFQFSNPGTYIIEVTASDSNNDCPITQYLELIVEENGNAFIPNSFSPNGDDHNDYFFIKGHGINSFSLKIYNRSGKEIANLSEFGDKWDGRFNGEDVPEGIYSYVFIAAINTGELYSKGGTITLIR